MLSIEAVKELLKFNTWKKPQELTKGVIDYYGMSLHIDGILPAFINADGMRIVPDVRVTPEYQYIFDNYLFSKHPREKAEQRWWRYSQYRPLQKDAFLRVISVINAAIFQDTGYSVVVESKEDEDYVWATNETQSVNFFSQFINNTKNIHTDSFGFLTVIPSKGWIEKPESEKCIPYIKFIFSKSIIYLSDEEIVFDDNGIVWLINTVGYYRFKKNEKGEYYMIDTDGYYAHLLGYVPIVKAGGFVTQHTTESWLSGAKAYADEYVSCRSSEQLVNKEGSHPFIIAAASDCPECHGVGHITYCSECDNLVDKCSCNAPTGTFIKPKLLACTSCGGGGKQSRNPGDWLLVPKEDMGEELIKIINPDVSVNEHLKNTSESIYNSFLSALHLDGSDKTQSGVAKTKDLETRYQFIMAISNDWFDRLIPSLLNYALALRNARAVNGVVKPFVPEYTIIKPTQFNVKTASDLLIEYQISVQSGMPQYIRNRQLEDYIDKHFGGDKVMAKTVRVINELDILASDTATELADSVGTFEWYYHKQLPSVIKKVVREMGEITFIEADIDTISEWVNKYIKKEGYEKFGGKESQSNPNETNDPINGIYGEGNHATVSGKSPTGTGFYNQDDK